MFCWQQLVQANDVYLRARDEVVVTKAGTQPYGLDRFFSGVYQRPVVMATCRIHLQCMTSVTYAWMPCDQDYVNNLIAVYTPLSLGNGEISLRMKEVASLVRCSIHGGRRLTHK